MEIGLDSFACEWCGLRFPRRCRAGRKPLYCRRSCRQRAYEHRRARRMDPDLRKPLPIFHTDPSPGAPRWYEGTYGGLVRPVHALRPDGLPDRCGKRPTLCGARAVSGRQFQPGAREMCKTCSAIAQKHPPRWTVRPDIELPVLRDAILRRRAVLEHTAPDLVDLAKVA